MPIGAGNVDSARTDGLSVLGCLANQLGVIGQYLGQAAFGVGRNMLHHKDRKLSIRRNRTDHVQYGFHPSG